MHPLSAEDVRLLENRCRSVTLVLDNLRRERPLEESALCRMADQVRVCACA